MDRFEPLQRARKITKRLNREPKRLTGQQKYYPAWILEDLCKKYKV